MKSKSKIIAGLITKEIEGQDSLLISNSEIIKRNSFLSTSTAWDDIIEDIKENRQQPGGKKLQEKIEGDDYLKKILKEEFSEGKYVIKKRLTSGGMGEIYYVYDSEFKRYSAMKLILPELKHNSKVIDSFIREARITGQLEHPNIIPVHDVGYLPDHGIYFTMKLMHGESLNSLLNRIELGHSVKSDSVKKYDLFMLLNIFRKICDAIAFAHSKNIIHRDIKPHNIMVGDFGEVLLMDWGLAKYIGIGKDKELVLDQLTKNKSNKGNATEYGIIKGSPAYMSPEQAYGDTEGLDYQSDIFLLGATLYHMLTFYPPYLGDNIYEILENARKHDFTHANKMDTSHFPIPEDLNHIILKSMAKDKKDRYLTVNDFINDIDGFLRGEISFCHRVYKKGETLMEEGEAGFESYVIVKGKVNVCKMRNGKNEILSTLEKGDIVGEMSLITSECRSASVIAIESTEVMILTQELFTQHLTLLPRWLGQTIVLLAERLNAANNMTRL